MSGYIWHWRIGNKKIFTKKMDVVTKAINEGCLVTRLKTPSRVINNKNNGSILEKIV